MDPLIAATARALAAGDPLGALKLVALREDAPGLALRGMAMAQLGDHLRARTLLRRAARAFGPTGAVARARCVVAEAEVALVSRDLAWPEKTLAAARATLAAHGDAANAAHAGYLEVRRLLLTGRLTEAERVLTGLDPSPFPPAMQVAHDLMAAGIALRRLHASAARAALDHAGIAARRARIPALVAEVEGARRVLDTPVARRITGDGSRPLLLDHVETLLASRSVVVDACRHLVWHHGKVVPLVRRPVLFALVRILGEAWPGDVSRDELVTRVFGARNADDSHRARLRVEIGRLRALLGRQVGVHATKRGFVLAPRRGETVVVLAHAVDEEHAAILAFLADGEAWSSSALALSLGTSQRTVQRALDALAAAGKAHASGRGRARRWMTPPVPGFATALLLPAPLPIV